MSAERRRDMIDSAHADLPIARQCELISLSRSIFYYAPVGEGAVTLGLMRLIDEEYTRHPFYGGRKMTSWLRRQGYAVNRKRVRRLMRRMGLQSVAPKPCTSRPAPAHPVCRGQSETGRNLTI